MSKPQALVGAFGLLPSTFLQHFFITLSELLGLELDGRIDGLLREVKDFRVEDFDGGLGEGLEVRSGFKKHGNAFQ